MADIKQHDDGSLSIYSDQEGKSLFRVGGVANPAAGGSQVNYRAPYHLKIPLSSGSALTGGMAAWQNTGADDLIVGQSFVDVTTGQTVSFTISIGITTSSTAFGNNLIDALHINPNTTGTFDNVADIGSAGKSRQKLPINSFITVTSLVSTPNTFVGTFYAEVIKA